VLRIPDLALHLCSAMPAQQRAPILVAATLLAAGAAFAGTIEGRISRNGPLSDLSNFVLSVEDIEGAFPAPQKAAVMDQKGLRFVPHVLVIQVGSMVAFPNSDPVSHNIFSISDAKRFNLGLYGRGAMRQIKFDRAGVVGLLCNVHLEMAAYIVVVKNPYFAQTGADGTFRINGVPAGKHSVRCWHERFPVREQIVQVPETGFVRVDLSMGD
jgi:plastocyanin